MCDHEPGRSRSWFGHRIIPRCQGATNVRWNESEDAALLGYIAVLIDGITGFVDARSLGDFEVITIALSIPVATNCNQAKPGDK